MTFVIVFLSSLCIFSVKSYLHSRRDGKFTFFSVILFVFSLLNLSNLLFPLVSVAITFYIGDSDSSLGEGWNDLFRFIQSSLATAVS